MPTSTGNPEKRSGIELLYQLSLSLRESYRETERLLAAFEAVAVRLKSEPKPPPRLPQPITMLRKHAKTLDEYAKRLDRI